MARPLGACFHLAHEFSRSAAPERYACIAAEMGETDIVAALQKLNRDLHIIPTLRALGVAEARYENLLPKMAHDALASGSPANNPRLATADEIIALYRQAYHAPTGG